MKTMTLLANELETTPRCTRATPVKVHGHWTDHQNPQTQTP
jgi:hypothetical protein